MVKERTAILKYRFTLLCPMIPMWERFMCSLWLEFGFVEECIFADECVWSFRYAGPVVLYTLYGLFDAVWQTYCYWIMGALTNETAMAARMAGFYKAWQNAGAVTITTSFATCPAWFFNPIWYPINEVLTHVFIDDEYLCRNIFWTQHHFKKGFSFSKEFWNWNICLLQSF